MQGAKLIERLVKLCASSYMLNTVELGKLDHPAGVSEYLRTLQLLVHTYCRDASKLVTKWKFHGYNA